jgi:NAD(P)-dependent dehydrogenase (short-subunit alcohol dehydrogenase family)
MKSQTGQNPASFGARSSALEVIAGHDLRGRDVIVTGGASGIGLETVRALATAGARAVIATRNREKAEAAAAALREATGNPAIEVGLLDLASLSSVRDFVQEYLAQGRKLHLLINNAGVFATPQAYTKEGFELQFAINHLGHFALTVGLLPALRAAGTSRVVTLTSSGHRFSDIHYDDIHFRSRPYDPFLAYGQSKTATALFAVGLTQRHAPEGITSNAVHPGGIMTGLFRNFTRDEQVQRGWLDASGAVKPHFKTAEQGAATTVWAAVAPELSGRGGLYLDNCAIAEPMPDDQPTTGAGGYRPGYKRYALDSASAQRLWTVSEEFTDRDSHS